MLGSLFARLRGDHPSAGHREALEALERRVAVLEANAGDYAGAVADEAERAARWADMQAQLRRFLGRLDAHAGHDKEPATEAGKDPKVIAAALRAKFPNAGV